VGGPRDAIEPHGRSPTAGGNRLASAGLRAPLRWDTTFRCMADAPRPQNFLADIVAADVAAGKERRQASSPVSRPEPNGFLHIGHSEVDPPQLRPRARVRRPDAPPLRRHEPGDEETEYVEAIQADVRWLGCEWGKHLYYASDYFTKMYECAERLVARGRPTSTSRRRRRSASSAAPSIAPA